MNYQPMHAVDLAVSILSRGSASFAPIEVQKLIISKQILYADISLKAARSVLAVNRGHAQNTNVN